MSANLLEALSSLAEQHAAVERAEEQFRRLVPKPGGVAINPRPLDLVMLAAMHRSRRYWRQRGCCVTPAIRLH